MNMLTKLKVLRDNADKARRDAFASVDETRDQIGALNTERKAVMALPGLKADALDALEIGFDRDFQKARRDLSLAGLVRSQPPRYIPPSPETMLALVVEANRNEVRKIFEAEIDQHFASGDGISLENRSKKLARIDGELDQLERGEEGLIREAEAAGMPILRRADADPNVLLLSDRALGIA